MSCGGSYKPFGEMTRGEVADRAAELKAACEVPAIAQRMAGVAAAWTGLAEEMEREAADTVAALDHDRVEERAERLRIVPAGGSLL